MSNIKDLLAQIDANTDTTCSVFVPSLQQEVIFEQLTVAQQKEIIKGSLNGVKGNLLLTKTYNNIILANSSSKSDVYTIIDRNAILVQLRIASLGERVILDDKDRVSTLSLDWVIQCVTSARIVETEAEIEYSGIVVNLETPTLTKDLKYFDILGSNEYDNAGDVVNDVYVAEAAKFIKQVSFGGLEVTPTAKESIELIDKLPLALNAKIVEFIKHVKEYDAKFLQVGASTVTLNARFFNIVD